MRFDDVALKLKMPPYDRKNFRLRWRESGRTMPASGAIPFLSEDFIRKYFAELNYREDLSDELCRTAKAILRSPELTRFAWHLYYRTFLDPEGGIWMPRFDIPRSMLNGKGGLFNLLVALGSVPLIERKYAEFGIPREYALNHHSWISGTIDIYRSAHDGRPGHTLCQTAWLRLAVDGILFRVGRFEYLLEKSYPEWCPPVFRSLKTGKIAVLASNRWKYDGEWNRVSDRACAPAHNAFIRDDGQFIEGIRLLCDGSVDKNIPCRLDKKEWTPLLSPWDLVVSMHIPGGGGMTPELMRESLSAAPAFFGKYLHRDLAMICCESWILNPEWQKRMPESNISKLQRSVFLVEQPADGGRDGLFFVFGRDDGNPPAGYPADNSLRRAMLGVLKDGLKLRSGSMILPVCLLPEFGTPDIFN